MFFSFLTLFDSEDLKKDYKNKETEREREGRELCKENRPKKKKNRTVDAKHNEVFYHLRSPEEIFWLTRCVFVMTREIHCNWNENETERESERERERRRKGRKRNKARKEAYKDHKQQWKKSE